MKLIHVVLAGALALAGGAARAAGEDGTEAALRFLEAMDMKTVLAQTIEQATAAELAKNPALEPYRGVFLEFMHRHMGYDSIKADMAAMYAEAFTREELIELAAFYQTPLGRKATQALPALMIKGGQYGQRKVQDNIGELQEMIAVESRRIQTLQGR